MTTTTDIRSGESCERPKNTLQRILGTLRRGRTLQDKRLRQRENLYDSITVRCKTQGCPGVGREAVVDVRLENNSVLLSFNKEQQFCEHMWKQAKDEVDDELDLIKEEAQMKWCPKCINRVPKTATICPECDTILA